MAANEVLVKFKLDADGNLKALAADADRAAASTDNLSKSARSQDRALKGAAQASSNSTKNFAKMSQGISGGLVPAYAALAANIFAITALFGALQRAARVEQLTQGLQAMGDASGVAMGTLSRGLQESTGFALSLEEAMRSTALITSAGLDPSSVEEFGLAAKNASLALGRDTAESLERFTRGVTKLEPELLDELGLFVRVDQAAEEYARSIGKSASELTNFEKRQAFANEALTQANEKYGALGDIDVSAFDKLAATFTDLSKTLLNILNIAITPFVSALASNAGLLLATMTALAATISKQIVGGLSSFAESSAQVAGAQQELNTQTAEGLMAYQRTGKTLPPLIDSMKKGETDVKKFTSAIDGQVQVQRIAAANIRKNTGDLEENRAVVAKAVEGQKVLRIVAVQSAQATMRNAEATTIAQIEAGNYRGALTSLRAQLSAYTTGVRVAGIQQGFLSKAMAFGRVTALGLAGAFRVAGAAFTALLGPISMIIAVISLAVEGIKALIEMFKSPEQKEYEKSLDSTRQMMDELTSSFKEADLALAGQSDKIQTTTQRVIAYGTALGQVQDKLKELENSGYAGSVEGQIEVLQKAQKESQIFREALQEKGITIITAANLDIVKETVKEAAKAGAEIKAVEEAFKAATTATQDYVNSFTKSTPIDEMAASIGDLAKSVETAKTAVELQEILNEQAREGTIMRKLIDAAEGTTDKERIANLATAIKLRQQELQISQLTQDTIKAELAVMKELDLQTAEGVGARIDNENELIKAKITSIDREIEHIEMMKQTLGTAEEIRVAEENINKLKADRNLLVVKSFLPEEKMAEQLRATVKHEKEILSIMMKQLEIRKKAQEGQRKVNEMVALLAAENVGLSVGYEDQLALAKDVSVQQAEARAKENEARAKIIRLEFDLLEAQTMARQAELARMSAKTTDPAEQRALFLEAEALTQILGLRQEAANAELELLGTLENQDNYMNELREIQIEINKQRAQRLENQRTFNIELERAGLFASSEIQSRLDIISLENERAAILKDLRDAEKNGIEDVVGFQNLLNEANEITNDILEQQIGLHERIEISLIDQKMKVTELTRDLELAGIELEKIANTNPFTGEPINVMKSVKLADQERLARLAAAEKEKDMKLRVLDLEENILQQQFELLIAQLKMNAAQNAETAYLYEDIITSSTALHELRLEEFDLQRQLLKEEFALLDAKTKFERINAITGENAARAAKATPGGGMLSGITGMMSLISPDVEVDKDGKALTDAGQKALDFAKDLTETEKAVMLFRGTYQGMIEDMKLLGPEGEAIATMMQGTLTITDAFVTMGAEGQTLAGRLAAVSSVIAGLASIMAASSQRKVAGIEKEIAAEKKRDGQSSKSVQKIKELEKRKEQVERRAFERQKKMQMAQTVMSTAAGMAGVLSSVRDPFFTGPMAIAFAAIIAAMGAAQLAMISSQSFQGGGSGIGDTGVQSVSVGARRGSVDLARSAGGAGEIGYFRGERGIGGPEDFTPAFTGYRNRAEGGNTAFMVGEQGPEMFVPDRAGTIIPNDDIVAPTAVNATFNISTVDATGVEDLLTNQRGNIIDMIREAANANGEEFLETVRTTEL